MLYQFTRIFCEKCSCLALARLDGVPLCTRCLMSIVAVPYGKDIAKITPLILSLRKERWSRPLH